MVTGKRSTVKSYRVLSFLSGVSKAFEKFVNNRLVGHLAKCRLFSDFQYGFRSSGLTADLLIVAPDRLIYPRHLTWLGTLVFLTNLGFMEFQVKYLAFIFFQK